MDACAHGLLNTATGGIFGTAPLYTLGWEVIADGTNIPTCEATTGFGGRPGLTLDPISGGSQWEITVEGTTNHAGVFVGANLSNARNFYLQRIDSGGSVVDQVTDLVGGFTPPLLLDCDFAAGDLIVFGFDILGQAGLGRPTTGFLAQYVASLRWSVCLI